jgi:hypothetical protein
MSKCRKSQTYVCVCVKDGYELRYNRKNPKQAAVAKCMSDNLFIKKSDAESRKHLDIAYTDMIEQGEAHISHSDSLNNVDKFFVSLHVSNTFCNIPYGQINASFKASENASVAAFGEETAPIRSRAMVL